MSDTYTIRKGWVLGYKRWIVECSDYAKGRHFGLKRDAIQYVLEQERKQKEGTK